MVIVELRGTFHNHERLGPFFVGFTDLSEAVQWAKKMDETAKTTGVNITTDVYGALKPQEADDVINSFLSVKGCLLSV